MNSFTIFDCSPDLSLSLGNRAYDGSGFRIYSRFPWSAAAAQESPTGNHHKNMNAADNNNHSMCIRNAAASSTVPPGGTTTSISCCQAQGCDANLSLLKHYHRRHKVCDFHSKASAVLVSNIQQRFCQQCRKFHALSEFDGEKRSCRCSLATHNQRRQHRRRANRITSTSSTVPHNHRYHPYHPPINADAGADADAVTVADDHRCALSFLLPSDAAAPTSPNCADDDDRLCARSPLLISSNSSSRSSPDAASPSISPATSRGSTSDIHTLSSSIMATNSSSQSSRAAMGLRPFQFVL